MDRMANGVPERYGDRPVMFSGDQQGVAAAAPPVTLQETLQHIERHLDGISTCLCRLGLGARGHAEPSNGAKQEPSTAVIPTADRIRYQAELIGNLVIQLQARVGLLE